MDRDRFIELMNEDLQTEFQSVVHYVQAEALRPLLGQTQGHVRDLRGALGL